MMRFLVLFLIATLFPMLGAFAQAEKVKVVTRNVEPFSFEKDGRRVGYAYELWQDVARETGLQFDVEVVATAQDMINALENKTADVGVGALSATAKREAIIDFSQPFYEAGLQVLTYQSGSSLADSIWPMISGLFNLKFIGMFALLVFTMLVISHLVWMFEHKKNSDMWPEAYVPGMWESFWWTISTLLVGGADNKGPIGVGGRLVAIAWMLLSIVLVSLLTASFTTTLTVNSLQSGITGPNDLPNKAVATIKGSTSETWLTKKGARVETFAAITECVDALRAGNVEAVVFDAPILQYQVKKSGDPKLMLVGPIFERQNYAIGLQQNSPLRENINRALLNLQERGLGLELREKWFGQSE